MSNKKVGLLNVKDTISYEGGMPEPFKSKGSKEAKLVYVYFQNLEKGTCTCIIRHVPTGKVKGIGVAKCHPKDTFCLTKGLPIAEYRAKIDQYERNIKLIGKEQAWES